MDVNSEEHKLEYTEMFKQQFDFSSRPESQSNSKTIVSKIWPLSARLELDYGDAVHKYLANMT